MEKLRLFVFEGVADELQYPAKNEQSGGKHPERMKEEGGHGKRQRNHDQRNANAMAQPVYRMSMAACILRDPLFAGASAKHGRIIPHALSYFGLVSLGRKQKDACWPGMDVAIRADLLMSADVWILQAKGNDLAFFIDGKSADQHDIIGKVGNCFV